MGSSPNFHHMQVLINAAAPAICDRIAGRSFTYASDDK